MQTTLSRIWTWVAGSIFYDDKYKAGFSYSYLIQVILKHTYLTQR